MTLSFDRRRRVCDRPSLRRRTSPLGRRRLGIGPDQVSQHVAGERAGDAAGAAEGGAIQPVHRLAQRRGRARQAREQPVLRLRRHPVLAVGQQAGEQQPQQRVVRRQDLHRGDGAQAGGQVAQLDRPARRRCAGGEQHRQARLGGGVQQVQQRGFLGHRVGVVDGEAGGARQVGQRVEPGQRRAGEVLRAGRGDPAVQQVRLAAAGLPPQRQAPLRPVRDAIEPGQRRVIRRRTHEIGHCVPGGAREGQRAADAGLA